MAAPEFTTTTRPPSWGIRRFFQLPARLILRLWGWRIVGQPPQAPKHILIGAHHTSNMDGILLILVTTALNYHLNFLMKDSLFRGPMGPLARWLGAIPIDRSTSHNTVEQITAIFAARESLALAIAPEGTRKRAPYWRSGFYHMAVAAEVPLVMACPDYGRKEVRFSEPFMPSGDIAADMDHIRAFFEGVTPRYPEKAGPIQLRQDPPVS